MSEATLKQKTVTGVIWSAIERFSTLAIQMTCTLIIARFLTPEDFGTVGMLTIFTAIAQTFVDSGFKTALIRKEDVTNIDYSSVFYFNIVLSIILYTILFFASPYIALFYKMPILEYVSKFTFLVIPVSALGLVQNTILTKNINFKTIARATFVSAFISGIVGVYLAYTYRNLWAIVIQNLVFYSLQSLSFWFLCGWKPILEFSFTSIKGMFSFSFNMMLSGLIGTIFNNLYGLLIGKIYTATDLGNYSQAQKLQSIPSSSITDVILRVTFPVLSKFQNDDKSLKNAYRKMIGVAFLIVSYVMFWMMGISKQLFDVLFNDQWIIAGNFFAILCFNGVFYPLHSININILTVKGKSDVYLKLEITRRIICLIIVAISAFFSIDMFIWGLVIYSILVLIINLSVCGRYIEYDLWSQLKDLAPTFFNGVVTMLVLKYVVIMLPFHSIFLLIIQTIVAFVMLVVFSKMSHNVSYLELTNIIRPYYNKIRKQIFK